MKAVILQHEKDTPPGSIVDWLLQKSIEYKTVEIFNGHKIPNVDEFDMLIICGGSMNVDQESIHHWLHLEKKIILESIYQQKILIGLCLGAQLIAECLGGKVRLAEFTEVGWHTVYLGKNPLLKFSEQEIKVFQWHSYAFSDIKNVDYFATNKACKYQAFTYMKNVVAFQFHPESTKAWIIDCCKDGPLPTGKYCQNSSEILKHIDLQEALQIWFFNCLDQFFGNQTK